MSDSAPTPVLTLPVAGTELVARGDRTLFWPDRKTLFAADVHLGKDAAFRAQAVPVPLGSTRSDLRRLSHALAETGAERLVVLGDLFHAASGMTTDTIDAVVEWREKHRSLTILLVRGNHDRNAGPLPARLDLIEREAPVGIDPFAYCHRPGTSGQGYVLCGHIHPAVKLRGPGGEQMRLPCFHRRSDSLILPAFGEFTGSHTVTPRPNETVYAVVDGDVVDVSTGGKAVEESR